MKTYFLIFAFFLTALPLSAQTTAENVYDDAGFIVYAQLQGCDVGTQQFVDRLHAFTPAFDERVQHAYHFAGVDHANHGIDTVCRWASLRAVQLREFMSWED